MKNNRKINNETLTILINENKRLKRENQRLYDSLNELDRYKNEYKVLIDKLKDMKNTYMKKIKEFDKLEKKYRKELECMIKNN